MCCCIKEALTERTTLLTVGEARNSRTEADASEPVGDQPPLLFSAGQIACDLRPETVGRWERAGRWAAQRRSMATASEATVRVSPGLT
jgi:hypothetical protein